jgi:hypothetical protein
MKFGLLKAFCDDYLILLEEWRHSRLTFNDHSRHARPRTRSKPLPLKVG